MNSEVWLCLNIPYTIQSWKDSTFIENCVHEASDAVGIEQTQHTKPLKNQSIQLYKCVKPSALIINGIVLSINVECLLH